MTPRAKTGLLSEPLDDELIVYDQGRDRGHCLNRTAAMVWRLADGERSIADIAAILRSDLDAAADENLVWHTLDQLNAVELLEAPMARSTDDMRASRRRFVSKVGVVGVAALLLPIVTSVTAPAPAVAGATSSGSSGGFSLLQAEWLSSK